MLVSERTKISKRSKLYLLSYPPSGPLRQSSFSLFQVLFVYNAIDDFVMNNIKTYAGRNIKTAEAEDIDLGEHGGADKDGEEGSAASTGAVLNTEEAEDLCSWLKESALADRVSEVWCERVRVQGGGTWVRRAGTGPVACACAYIISVDRCWVDKCVLTWFSMSVS